MKASLFLGVFFAFLAGELMAQPRVVQKASAQTADLVCNSSSGCPAAPDTLTVSFAPTGVGDALLLVYDGDLVGFSARVCTDNLNQAWTHVDGDGLDYYFPVKNPPGLTSVTCRGGIGRDPNCASCGLLSSLLFFELSGVDPQVLVLEFLSKEGPSPKAVPPLQCGSKASTLPASLALYFMDTVNFSPNPVRDTITPLDANVHNELILFQSTTDNGQVIGVDTRAFFSELLDGTTGDPFFSFNVSTSTLKLAQCTGIRYDPIFMVDPFPDLMNGPKVVSVTDTVGQGIGGDLLSTKGRPVSGIAADGVSQILLRVPALNAGDQYTFTILNEQFTPSVAPSEDGALGNPGDTSFNIMQSQISVSAVHTAHGNFAFAIYRAPLDFARSAGQDAARNSRIISVEVSINGKSTNHSLTIVRPPVVLIHGLWSNYRTWDNFAPLVTGQSAVDSRFSVLRANYDNPITGMTASNPAYPVADLQAARGNSMGFAYNTLAVLVQMSIWLQSFRTGSNPAGLQVAVAQFDAVAHSMGGDIALTLPLLPGFKSNSNFGEGAIHKLITIGTPHLGTPLQPHVLDPAAACMRNILKGGGFVFATATINGAVVSGAVGDLNTGSNGIQAIHGGIPNLIPPNTAPIPTALIAGQYTNWASLDCPACKASIIRNLLCRNDPAAQLLTGAGWQSIFAGGDARNDTMVAVTSQLNGLGDVAGFVFPGVLHSSALVKLNFTLPSELDANTAISNQVILLLNTPVTDAVFHPLGPSSL